MSSFPNYHNRQNTDFTSPFSGYSGSMQRNPRYNDNQDSLSNQKNMENLLEMLKKKDAGSDNPFYDNSYQHNLNVLPNRAQDLSADPQYPSITGDLDQKPPSVEYERRESLQRPPMQPERRGMERNEAPALRNYDKKGLQDNNSGNFFSGMGENNRHKNLVKDYQEYMRNNPIPHPKDRKAIQNDNDRNKVSLRKRNDQDQANDWYGKNVSVGILPGLGAPDNNRRQYASPEFRNMPDGYGYESSGVNRRSPEVEDYRRGMSDMAGPSKMNPNPSGSRLAGIGSRLIDGDRPYQDQMRTPQYTPSREAMRFNFQTPQDPRKSVELGMNNEGRFREMQGYSNEAGRYDNRQPEMMAANFDNMENFRNQNAVAEERRQYPARQGQDRRGEGNSGNNGSGLGWLEERQRQEQDKRNKQREDLQKIYREQIEEKKRKKDEEQRIKMLEDQKEEERLRKENEDLQNQFLLEQQKKRDAEEPKKAAKGRGEEITDKDYLAARKRQNKHNRAFEMSEENVMRREVPEPEYMEENRMRYGQEEMNIDDMIKDTAKRYEDQFNSRSRYEFSKDPEVEVHREFTKKINATLDEEIEKMRRDVDYHAKLIRNELSSFKTQAMVSQELRENAHKELQRLKQELKNQQIMEERHPYEGFDARGEDGHAGKSKERDLDRPEHKINFQLPHKSYAKAFSPDEDVDLGASSPGLDLDFDTNYVPARETGIVEPRMYREPPKLNELMNKYGVDDGTGQIQHRNDAAMKKFGALFPGHGSKPQGQDSLAALEARLENNTYMKGQQFSNPAPVQAGYSYGKGSVLNKDNRRDLGEVEGEDEIEKIEALLKRYRDPDLQEKENARREVMNNYNTYEKRVMKEFEEEGFGAKGSYRYSDNYGKGEDDTDRNELETPIKSEVELANITHEVSITHV